MADIFISYTSSDRDWAFWISDELRALGHTPHVHQWEIKGSEDIYAWMERRHDAADRVLCVISDEYLKAPYSTLERQAALWQAANKRPGFALLVVVKPCRLPTLSDHLRRCELFGLPEEAARARFREFITTAPIERSVFPGKVSAVSNIPVRIPAHFLGRHETLAEIATSLASPQQRLPITVLHGLRGVGKTVLAAAYADQHRDHLRAAWWIRSHSAFTIRADLMGLGVRLGWVPAEAKEEPAVATVLERLQSDGEGILLIYDGALDADAIRPFVPHAGATQVIITSNAHAWRGIASPIEIKVWPQVIGADYLIARTGRENERAMAEVLSKALEGLPLAHEQAGAYCENLELPFSEYHRRFNEAPVYLLDDKRNAPADYRDGLTVAKTFSLAIEEAARINPAAEPLIVNIALLGSEPVPLFAFIEATQDLAKELPNLTSADGLNEAIAALRMFALVYRESIADERAPSIVTDTVRLHRLVLEVAAARRTSEVRTSIRCIWASSLAAMYSQEVFDPASWPRERRLDGVAMGLIRNIDEELLSVSLLNGLAWYRHNVPANYRESRELFERALALTESAFGPDDIKTADSHYNLAITLHDQGEYAEARSHFERALAIRENRLGPDHPSTATALDSLALLLQETGRYSTAGPLVDRALAIRERVLGPEHPDTARSLNTLAGQRMNEGPSDKAKVEESIALFQRSLAIREKALGYDHPLTISSVTNIALYSSAIGDLAAAHTLYDRALASSEKTLGTEHPEYILILANFGLLLMKELKFAEAQRILESCLNSDIKLFGPMHHRVGMTLGNLADLHADQDHYVEAVPLYERALATLEQVHGFHHPAYHLTLHKLVSVNLSLGNLVRAQYLCEQSIRNYESGAGRQDNATLVSVSSLGDALRAKGDISGAQAWYRRGLRIAETLFGLSAKATGIILSGLASICHEQGDFAQELPIRERIHAIFETVLGPEHLQTVDNLEALARLKAHKGDFSAAVLLHERAMAGFERALGPDHATTGECIAYLADVHAETGNLTTANALYERAFRIFTSNYGPEHHVTNVCLMNLAFVILAQGNRAKAEPLLQRARDIFLGEGDFTTIARLDRRRRAFGVSAPKQRATSIRSPSEPTAWGKVGRNDPCPCGSGKKFKRCHGTRT